MNLWGRWLRLSLCCQRVVGLHNIAQAQWPAEEVTDVSGTVYFGRASPL
jgi:hypothetical protein